MSISAKQQRFVEEYLKDPQNITRAYRLAGYKASDRSANVNASRLLKNADIRAAIAEGQREIRQNDTLVTLEYVIGGLKEVAQRCMQRERVMVGTGKNRKPLIITVTDPETGKLVDANVWTFDSAGANRSLELLGKHIGAFTEDDEVADAPMPAVINVNVINARKTA